MTTLQSLGSDHSRILSGLYLILDAAWVSRCSLEDVIQEAVDAGVRLIQYRDKSGSMQDAYRRAKALRAMAPLGKVLFIVNDRCDLALAVQADGVHLGQEDLPVALARQIVGRKLLIGLSTHNREQVRLAPTDEADYLGFGPICPTETKAHHDPVVGVAGLAQVRSLTTLPVFAIGGITPTAIPSLREAGADGVAVASGILGASDRQEAFRQFMAPFKSAS